MKLQKLLQNIEINSSASGIFYRSLSIPIPATTLMALKCIYLVETKFKHSYSSIDLISMLVFIFLLAFGFFEFIKKSHKNSILYFFAAFFIYLSLSSVATLEVRKLAGKTYISNNPDVVRKIKSEGGVYYLDIEKEREAIFYDSEGALNNGTPSNEWLERNRAFNSCPFWPIPIDRNVYLINFGC